LASDSDEENTSADDADSLLELDVDTNESESVRRQVKARWRITLRQATIRRTNPATTPKKNQLTANRAVNFQLGRKDK
jgi:hypothetical protein